MTRDTELTFGLKPHHFAAVLVDPPWNFRTWSAKGTGRGAVSHYDTMGYPDLTALPVADLAADDCALFLWATDPLLNRALELIEAWGFTYRTVAFTWVKPTKAGDGWCMGCGYWTRANPEICLLGTRGRPKRLSRAVRQLIVAPRREHSRKPEEARERIEQLVAGPYVELFARDNRAGWSAWGLETGLFDNGAVRTRRQPSNLVERQVAENLIPETPRENGGSSWKPPPLKRRTRRTPDQGGAPQQSSTATAQLSAPSIKQHARLQRSHTALALSAALRLLQP
jgi:N6-adenosine-specific RNA methylase IME4